ncbi:P-loop containing nucleoside triphosphate hydrolase protein [Chytriomyces sp. MP71]|nr:P-loop containing nucleoside triphosphate hydrolase protein [Chytriomyces sp. MP71]
MFRSPSILLLDDLDLICPSNAENADGLGSRQITELIISQVQRFCVRTGSAPGAITLLATAADKSTIHARFISSHAIADFVHLSAPGRTQRAEILKAVLSRRGHKPEIDVMPIASATEGYRPVDLETLVSRAVHCSAVRRIGAALGGSVSVEKEIVTKDLENALSGYMPPVLKGLKMGDNDSAIGWRDIGGLHEPKKMLIETLEWPTKYAAIFASCPLRLRSGILLYGYPGCGKTILAAAVAKECGLNFISVKGPEILNKYIGESEKSVRDLFDRAQSAKPCILFFDEFDSIAPRRGNDNTGVTDRVVNQLLTQMDGAEGLDGVYVLAATSRPDLIDPALLRPGRLDKSVLCGMPSIDERIEILEAVSRKLQLSEHLDFSAYGDACENFTGADLQGLIYSAQLEAIHEQIDEKPVPSANLAPEAGGTAKGKGKGKGKAKAPIQEENVKGVHDGKSEATVQFDVLQSGDGSSKVLIGAERSKLKQRVQVIQANGWSGAVENSGSFGKTKGAITTSPSVVIYPRHFEAALAETRGSLTLQERIRFDQDGEEKYNGMKGGVVL